MESSPAAVPPAPALDPRAVLQHLLDGLGISATVEHVTLDGATLLHIATTEPAHLIGKHGQTLGQLQFLLNRILQHRNPDTEQVIVDCEHYRERQRDDLLHQIVSAADKVRRWGDPVQIGPYGAFDRRLIHRHMDRDPELEAISDGVEEHGRKTMTIRIRQQPKSGQLSAASDQPK